MQRFAQSEPTATRRTVTFKLVDRTDNLTPEPGLLLTGSEVAVSKNGGGFVTAIGTALEVTTGGFYKYEFTAAELNTLGNVRLRIDDAAAAIVTMEFEVRSAEQVYGHLYDGAIWIDGIFGAAGAVIGINGTRSSPVNNPTDARTLADALGVRHYKIIFAAPLTITVDHIGWFFEGVGPRAVTASVVVEDPGGGFPGLSISTFKNLQFGGNLSNTSGPILFQDCTIVGIDGLGQPMILLGESRIESGIEFVAGGSLAASGNVVSAGGDLVLETLANDVVIRGASGDWLVTLNDPTGTVTIDFALPGAVTLAGTGGSVAITNPKSVVTDPDIALTLTPGAALFGQYDGAIWVDTIGIAGGAGAVLGVNGTKSNPVNNATDARTLADALGVRHYKILFASAFFGVPFTFTADHVGWFFEGVGSGPFLIDIQPTGSPALDATTFKNVAFSGSLASADPVIFEDATIVSATGIVSVVILRGRCTVQSLVFGVAGSLKATGDVIGDAATLTLGTGAGDAEIRGASGDWTVTINDPTPTVTIDFAIPGAVTLAGTGGSAVLVNPKSVTTDPDVALTLTPGAALLGLYPDDAVYLDFNGAAGSAPGINGIPNNPCSVLADALSLLSDLNLARLKIFDAGSSIFVLDGDVSGLTVESVAGFPIVNLDAVGGGVFDGATIRRCQFQGDAGDISAGGLAGLFIEECLTSDTFTFEGTVQMRNCIIRHTQLHKDAKFVQILFARDCEFLDASAIEGPADIDFQGNSALVLFYGARGKVRFINNSSVEGPGSEIDNVVNLREGAQLIIAASSIGDGVYHVSGGGKIIDQTAAGASIVLNALLDQVGGLDHEFLVAGVGTATTVPVVSPTPAGAFFEMRVRVTDISGAITEERIVKAHTKPVAGQDDTVLELATALSFVPVTGDEVVVRQAPQVPLPLANTFQDNEVYVPDGDSKVLTNARIRVFPTAALAGAATKNAAGLEGAIAVFAWTAAKGAEPGEPEQARMVNTTP